MPRVFPDLIQSAFAKADFNRLFNFACSQNDNLMIKRQLMDDKVDKITWIFFQACVTTKDPKSRVHLLHMDGVYNLSILRND